jgi:N-acetylneuraminic acid mutarotase|tara:strand:- start:1353 stop:1616 length:264 start_codon:yes stop_codon:yes gene_type:complete
MPKKQKVRFHKGDRKPKSDKEYNDLSYKVKMKKKGRKILWQVLEQPTKNTIAEYFFEEDAQKLADFQNKNQVWKLSGGIPKMFWIKA